MLDDTVPESTEKKKSNFGSSNLIKNMGIMLLVTLGIAIFLLILWLGKWLALRDYKYYRVYMTIHDKVFYNTFIRFV